jgi:hypothetical protein
MITVVSLNKIFAISFRDMPHNPLICSLCILAKQHLANSMEHSSSDNNNSEASKGIPHGLWKPKVYYSVHNNPPRFSIQSHINPIHIFTHFKIHFNVISIRLIPFSFFPQKVCIHFSSNPYVPHTPPISCYLIGAP